MAMYQSGVTGHLHREGHIMGNRNKRTSQGDGCRKRGSYRARGARKKYRGQGKR